jgi:hypothetical protein
MRLFDLDQFRMRSAESSNRASMSSKTTLISNLPPMARTNFSRSISCRHGSLHHDRNIVVAAIDLQLVVASKRTSRQSEHRHAVDLFGPKTRHRSAPFTRPEIDES